MTYYETNLHRLCKVVSTSSSLNVIFSYFSEGDTTIYLKIVTHKPDPPLVKDHMVPLLLVDYKNTPVENWDLTTQQVRPSYENKLKKTIKTFPISTDSTLYQWHQSYSSYCG